MATKSVTLNYLHYIHDYTASTRPSMGYWDFKACRSLDGGTRLSFSFTNGAVYVAPLQYVTQWYDWCCGLKRGGKWISKVTPLKYSEDMRVVAVRLISLKRAWPFSYVRVYLNTGYYFDVYYVAVLAACERHHILYPGLNEEFATMVNEYEETHEDSIDSFVDPAQLHRWRFRSAELIKGLVLVGVNTGDAYAIPVDTVRRVFDVNLQLTEVAITRRHLALKTADAVVRVKLESFLKAFDKRFQRRDALRSRD